MQAFIWVGCAGLAGAVARHGLSAAVHGALGSFTTFSAFMFDTWALIQDEQWLKASLNFLTHNTVGFSSFAGRVLLGRWL